MAFIGNNDFFVLEKNTGKVQRSQMAQCKAPCSISREQRLRTRHAG